MQENKQTYLLDDTNSPSREGSQDLENDNLNDLKDTRKLFSNSNPDPESLRKLMQKKSMSWFARNFSSFERGSLRVVIIMWIRMTMGVGVLALPFYFSKFGVITGVGALVLGALMCYLSYRFIFQSSVRTGIKEYSDLVDDLIPTVFAKLFKFTFTCDYMVVLIVYSVVGWNLFEYLAFYCGFMKEEWVIDEKTMQFDEYRWEVFTIRAVYFLVVYLALIPLFLKESLEKLKNLSMIFLAVMFTMIIIIMVENPFFRNAYKSDDTLKVEFYSKPPTLQWIPYFFSIILFFYVQPFILSLRKEVLDPSFQRLNKISTISVLVELLIYSVFGVMSYACLGDNYVTDLMIKRAPYPGKNPISEVIFKVGVFLFFLLNTIGIACYNPSIRQYLSKFSNMKNKSLEFKLLSLVPFAIACIVGILMPNIITIFGFIGLTICNFNGFIIPALMKANLELRRNGSKFCVYSCYALAIFYFACGVAGIVIKVRYS